MLIFGVRVLQRFSEFLVRLWMCNNNIDSDPGGIDIGIPLAKNQTLFKNRNFAKN